MSPFDWYDSGDEKEEGRLARAERPGIFDVLTSLGPVGVELDHTEGHGHDTGPENGSRLKWSKERRVSVARKLNAVLRAATEKIVANARAQRENSDVKGTTGDSRGRFVRRAARPSRRATQAALGTSAAGAPKARRKPQKRKADENEADSRPQTKKRKTQKLSEGAPPGTYYNPRLSRVAPIYQDVVAGERVLVNYIVDDPCPWEAPDDQEIGPCQRAVTPDDYFDVHGRINYWYGIPEERYISNLLKSAARKLRRYSRVRR
ncbi:uncharacterized protein [Branchiostoma lanceolatum]|uniref:uncharacterized protein n=1 Tax=Branchiostoma lanceolatum TaxID=7740 RepID=UPI0034544A05